MTAELLILLVVSGPIVFGVLIYFIGWCFTSYQDRVRETIGNLTDCTKQIATVYENPLDHESDDQMTEGYECPHCGAPNQTKVICEYCGSRNERKVKKNSNTQSGDSWSSNIMSLNW